MKKIKVLYIAGSGRSGSTILGNILGQADGFFHFGEIYHIWRSGLIRNELCGCGARFRECSFWTNVMDDAYGGMQRVNPRQMHRLKQSVRSRHFHLLITETGMRTLAYRSQKYASELGKLYRSIQKISEANVIIDSSKAHMQALTFSMIPGLELYVLHLVRDPKGVAFSWQKKKRNLGGYDKENMVRFGILRSSYFWIIRNLGTTFLSRKMPVQYCLHRYEDFVKNPHYTISKIIDWLEETSDLSFFIGSNDVELLAHQHTIHGNPVRFQTGRAVKIRLDNEWKKELSRSKKVMVTLLTLPLLIKYGYRLNG